MGEVIRFPQERRTVDVEEYRAEPALILILPTVRIDRDPYSILGGFESARCRAAFAELEAAVEEHST